MPYYTTKHGAAEYGRYMQIPSSALTGMVEGDDSIALQEQKFAQFMYQVNPSPLIISGGVISIDSVGLDDSGTVKLSGDQLKTFDQGAIDKLTDVETAIYASSISGDIVGLDDSGTVKLSGDQLKTFDQAAIDAIYSLTPVNYTSLIRVSGDFTYVMKAAIGTGTSGDAIWQIKRIEGSGDDTNILWADGDDNFDNAASGYLTQTYSL